MSTRLGVAERRRRKRVTLSVPILVTSQDPGLKLQAVCDTIDVSSNGAQFRLPIQLPPGTRLRLDILHSNRFTNARVVRSFPGGGKAWKVGVELLHQTGNFWGLISPPKDWETADNWDWY